MGRLTLRGAGRRGGSPVFTPASMPGLALQLEARRLDKLFQSNTGSTAVASQGDPIGYWADIHASAFDFSSIANDTTRPTYGTDGTRHWVQSNGSQILRRLSALGMYASGACSVFIAMRGNPSDQQCIMAERAAANDSPLYQIWSQSDADDIGLLIRNDAGSMRLGIGASFVDEALDDTDFVFGMTDNGSEVRLCKNGVLTDTDTYTRSDPTTLDRTALFGSFRAAPSGLFAGRIYAMNVVLGRAIDSSEIAANTSYLGALAGA